jgi:tetratricopeptide (TPR) repeat protein
MMRYTNSLLLIAAAVLAPLLTASAQSNSPAALIAAGDSLYNINDYAGSARAYEQAAALDTANFDAFWKLGRSLNLTGETAPKDWQLAIFEKARDATERALALNEASADAHFQLARAVGKIALFKGVFKSVGLAKRVKREAERALALDSLHDGAWHVLGRWHREVGKKPKLVRGPMGLGAANKRDAIAFMEKAVRLNPSNINHRLEMGITYREYDMDELAREQFALCLTITSRSPLDNKYQGEAKKYLAEIGEK